MYVNCLCKPRRFDVIIYDCHKKAETFQIYMHVYSIDINVCVILISFFFTNYTLM